MCNKSYVVSYQLDYGYETEYRHFNNLHSALSFYYSINIKFVNVYVFERWC